MAHSRSGRWPRGWSCRPQARGLEADLERSGAGLEGPIGRRHRRQQSEGLEDAVTLPRTRAELETLRARHQLDLVAGLEIVEGGGGRLADAQLEGFVARLAVRRIDRVV